MIRRFRIGRERLLISVVRKVTSKNCDEPVHVLAHGHGWLVKVSTLTTTKTGR